MMRLLHRWADTQLRADNARLRAEVRGMRVELRIVERRAEAQRRATSAMAAVAATWHAEVQRLQHDKEQNQ